MPLYIINGQINLDALQDMSDDKTAASAVHISIRPFSPSLKLNFDKP